nr:hypothetical protein CFP56_72060 [Quercus suber]
MPLSFPFAGLREWLHIPLPPSTDLTRTIPCKHGSRHSKQDLAEGENRQAKALTLARSKVPLLDIWRPSALPAQSCHRVPAQRQSQCRASEGLKVSDITSLGLKLHEAVAALYLRPSRPLSALCRIVRHRFTRPSLRHVEFSTDGQPQTPQQQEDCNLSVCRKHAS